MVYDVLILRLNICMCILRNFLFIIFLRKKVKNLIVLAYILEISNLTLLMKIRCSELHSFYLCVDTYSKTRFDMH